MIDNMIKMMNADYMTISDQIAYFDKIFRNLDEYVKAAVEDAYAKGLHDGSIDGIEEAYEEGFIAGQESVIDVLQ